MTLVTQCKAFFDILLSPSFNLAKKKSKHKKKWVLRHNFRSWSIQHNFQSIHVIHLPFNQHKPTNPHSLYRLYLKHVNCPESPALVSKK